MKLGTENRTMVYAAIGLGALALILVGNMLFNVGSAPSAGAPVSAPAASATSVAAAPGGKLKAGAAAVPSLDPSLRYDLLRLSEETKYSGTGRNVFLAEANIPQPIAPAILKQQQQQQQAEAIRRANTPPPPPPINLKFFGFTSKAGGGKKIFLSQGEDVFIASEGDIVDRRYRVLHISPTSVEIEDVLNNNRQSIPLTQS